MSLSGAKKEFSNQSFEQMYSQFAQPSTGKIQKESMLKFIKAMIASKHNLTLENHRNSGQRDNSQFNTNNTFGNRSSNYPMSEANKKFKSFNKSPLNTNDKNSEATGFNQAK